VLTNDTVKVPAAHGKSLLEPRWEALNDSQDVANLIAPAWRDCNARPRAKDFSVFIAGTEPDWATHSDKNPQVAAGLTGKQTALMKVSSEGSRGGFLTVLKADVPAGNATGKIQRYELKQSVP